jgi:hypothetical protein
MGASRADRKGSRADVATSGSGGLCGPPCGMPNPDMSMVGKMNVVSINGLKLFGGISGVDGQIGDGTKEDGTNDDGISSGVEEKGEGRSSGMLTFMGSGEDGVGEATRDGGRVTIWGIISST